MCVNETQISVNSKLSRMRLVCEESDYILSLNLYYYFLPGVS